MQQLRKSVMLRSPLAREHVLSYPEEVPCYQVEVLSYPRRLFVRLLVCYYYDYYYDYDYYYYFIILFIIIAIINHIYDYNHYDNFLLPAQ